MIDICPVGALTSKPFRYSARTWELSRRKSVSPHDSTGANLIVQVKNNKVMRVVPLENEAVNECWIADRDRFSYEALNSVRPPDPADAQAGRPMAGGRLEHRAGLRGQRPEADQGRPRRGKHRRLVQPAQHGRRTAPAGQAGARPGQREHRPQHRVRWLGTSIASLSQLQRVLVVGSNLRKDHPLFAQRIRQAAKRGCVVSVINESVQDWALPVSHLLKAPANSWAQTLANVACAVAAEKNITAPAAGTPDEAARAVAQSLLGGERKAILLGNAAAHHEKASSLLALANWIAEQTGASVGFLTEAANTVGAQLVRAMPGNGGLTAVQMLSGGLKAALLLNTEPVVDSAAGAAAASGLAKAQMVVTLSPFKTNLEFSDVLLPIAPFTETSGTFVNAEGRVQGFHAVVRPLGDSRPGWKVLRVLANLLGLPGFDFESSQDVLKMARGAQDVGQSHVASAGLSNGTQVAIDLTPAAMLPVTASIYQMDGLVRRSPALQATADARQAAQGSAA
jgi:NADH-quinone oxidoreductase subunit G